jgi:hypothetical protein
MFLTAQQRYNDAIAHHTAALLAMVSQLWALLDLFGGADAVHVPRAIHTFIFRALRPAESAVRRLIVIAARDLALAAPQPARTSPQNIRKISSPRQPAKRMAFKLFDCRKRIATRHKTYTTRTPRIYQIAPSAPFSPLALVPNMPPERPHILSAAERPITAHSLLLRLNALTQALGNIPHQAQRLMRWRQMRQAKTPPRFSEPLRPGKPPGQFVKATTDVDDILRECHQLALRAMHPSKPNAT